MKKILIVVLVVLLAIQVFRPARNTSNDTTHDIALWYPIPEEVKPILAKACNDCHSNHTRYPWYAAIQPVAWWLNNHVKDGKRHLNFNEFTGYRAARQYKKMEECIEQVKQGEMPLSSYTSIHKDAVLTDAEKQVLFHWCETVRDSIRVKYPADSLIAPKRKG